MFNNSKISKISLNARIKGFFDTDHPSLVDMSKNKDIQVEYGKYGINFLKKDGEVLLLPWDKVNWVIKK